MTTENRECPHCNGTGVLKQTRTRMPPEERRAALLAAATDIARNRTYLRINREDVAKKARCKPSLVNHYFGSLEKLRDEVLAKAQETQDPVILEQMRVNNHNK